MIFYENNIDYVAYPVARCPYLQKFGTYEGNGNAGRMYILGFRRP